jgi:GNAT superfamily N-acetyltransferase
MAIRVTPLETMHEVKTFNCGNTELNDFLQNTAGQHQRKSISKTYVLVDDAAPTEVMGFYTLAVRKMVPKEELPLDMAKKLPREVPGFTLARLAIQDDLKGRKHGEYLLMHALDRAARVAGEIGGYAVFVDAKNSSAAAFYQKYGFTPLPDQPLILCLPVRDIPITP